MPSRALPNLGLKAFYDLGEDGWKDEMDLNLLMLSVLVQAGAISKVSATPGAPNDKDVHILAGDHPTNANDIAVYDVDTWKYFTPNEGWLIYNRAEDYYEFFDGADWGELATGGGGGVGLPAGGTTGQILVKQSGADGDAEWTTLGGAIGTIAPNFFGALVKRSANVNAADYSSETKIAWDDEEFDDAGFHDTVTNNTRITIPAGVSKVRLAAMVYMADITPGNDSQLVIQKNGSGAWVGVSRVTGQGPSYGNANLSAVTNVVDVVEGDYFEVAVSSTDSSVTFRADLSSFGIEVVEGSILNQTVQMSVIPQPFRGALIGLDANQPNKDYTAATAVAFDAARYDTDGFWSAGAPTRFTVPAGVSKVRLTSGVEITNVTEARVFVSEVFKNGAIVEGLPWTVTETTLNVRGNNASSAVIDVEEGDYFELLLFMETDNDVEVVADYTWFAIEVVEATPSTQDGGAWEEIGSYDFAVDGAIASKDFTDLDDYAEFRFVGRAATSVNTDVSLRASVDNGTTFYSAAGDYKTVEESDGSDDADSSVLAYNGPATAAAKNFVWHILGNGSGVVLAYNPMIATTASIQGRRFAASTDPINALRLRVSAGTFAAGSKVTLYGRRKAKRGQSQSSPAIEIAQAARNLSPNLHNSYMRFTAGVAKTLTVQPEATIEQPYNGEWNLRNASAGDLTLVEGAGVTINPPAGGSLVIAQGMTATLKHVGTDEYDLMGQTS